VVSGVSNLGFLGWDWVFTLLSRVLGFSFFWFLVVTILVTTGNLPFAKAQTEPEFVPFIESEKGFVAQETEVLEAMAEVDPGTEELELRTPRGHRYIFPMQPQSDLAKMIYSQLDEDQKKKFQENRLLFLSRMASLLESGRLMVGFGSVVKSKAKSGWIKISQLFKPNNLELLQNMFKSRIPKDDPAQVLKFGESKSIGQRVVSAWLQQIDERLWAQSPLVAKQNEFSLVVSLGVQTLGGFKKKTFGGMVGLGFSFGFNRSSRALVFEVFFETEKIQRAVVPTFLIGFVPKFSAALREVDLGDEIKEDPSGFIFYAPSIPGAPVGPIASGSPRSVNLGVTTGWISFPPVVGDLFSYVNLAQRKTLLRFSVSPFLPGLLRVQLPGVDRTGPFLQSISNFLLEMVYRKETAKPIDAKPEKDCDRLFKSDSEKAS